jgi:hypothetical protein
MIDEDDFWSNWWNENWQRKPKYSEKTYPSATLSTTKSHMTFLHGLLFSPEDGGDMLLNNMHLLSSDYTVLHPRRETCLEKSLVWMFHTCRKLNLLPVPWNLKREGKYAIFLFT